MSRTARRRGVASVALAATLLLSACSGNDSPPAASAHDNELASMSNDLAGRSLTKQFAVKPENVTVTTTYSTVYDTKNWQITSNKTLDLKLAVSGDGAPSTEVMVEHMHADVSLLADNQTLNGWPQDLMDSSIHGGTQPGFAVTPTGPFNVVFSIQGLSETLISGWGYAVGGYGSIEIKEQRLTEDNLRNEGKVKGNKIIVVWVLLVKSKADKNFREVSFQDEFVVPVG